MMSSNGKEYVETLEQILNSCFWVKLKHEEFAAGLGRIYYKNFVQVELCDFKFILAMCARNWNRSYHPFLGFYFQRGASFKPGNLCEIMTDAEYFICHKNVSDEWEY